MNATKDITLKQKIRQGFRSLFYIWKEEVKNTFRDQGMLIFFILVPLAYPLIYAFIYTEEVAREVPVALVDDARGSLSREFARKVDATADVRIACLSPGMEDAKEQMRQGAVHGIIRIPAEFAGDLAAGRQAHVSIYCDMGCLLYYKNLLSACTHVSLDMNKDIKVARAGNTTVRQDEVTAYPFEYEDVALFNPQNGFASFLIPAVLVLILQQTLLLGIGLSAGTAREKNRFRDLVPARNRHYEGTLRIVMGKALCYFMLYAVVSVYVLCAVPRMFRLVQVADPATLILFMLPYLAACIFFSMTASAAVRNRETCMILFVFTSLPLLFISGVSWPGASIPAFWKYVSWLFPSTFGINGFIRINTMGATLPEVAVEYRALWFQTGIYFLTACLVYRHQARIGRRHLRDEMRRLRKQ